MGIEIPTNIKVLSPDFKELFTEVCTEVNRLSNLYADINRLRALVDRADPKQGGSSSVKFFEVISGGGSIVAFDDIAVYEYFGKVFDLVWQGGQLAKQNEIEINAYDIAITENRPLSHPAGSLTRDPLEKGTRVMCKELDGGYYVFSSVMPRFTVTC